MKKHISFPSIEQFRNVVASINRQANYVGADENGDAIYDPNLPKPVLKFKGNEKTVGEGIVFVCEYKGITYRFKSKGERHANGSKPKTLSKVDDEKIKSILDVVEKVTPVWRLEQMIEKSCDLINGGTLDRSKLGDYIRLVINDIIKEDMDILIEANLELKDVSKYISDVSRKYFFSKELL